MKTNQTVDDRIWQFWVTTIRPVLLKEVEKMIDEKIQEITKSEGEGNETP